MRIALHSEIVSGAVADYVQHHARVPDELADLFRQAGIHDWTIWRSGDRLFHLVDCDDWESATAAVKGHPADTAWQTEIGRHVAGFLDADGRKGYLPLERVWSLVAQRDDDATAC